MYLSYVVDVKMNLPSAEYTATDTTWAVAAGQLFQFLQVCVKCTTGLYLLSYYLSSFKSDKLLLHI